MAAGLGMGYPSQELAACRAAAGQAKPPPAELALVALPSPIWEMGTSASFKF